MTELKFHGLKRVYGRTKMHPNDVLDLVSARITVNLGMVNGCRFLLFYSSPDRDTRVAVVSVDWKSIISIWEKWHILSIGLRRVTPEQERSAQHLFRNYMLVELKKNANKNK